MWDRVWICSCAIVLPLKAVVPLLSHQQRATATTPRDCWNKVEGHRLLVTFLGNQTLLGLRHASFLFFLDHIQFTYRPVLGSLLKGLGIELVSSTCKASALPASLLPFFGSCRHAGCHFHYSGLTPGYSLAVSEIVVFI